MMGRELEFYEAGKDDERIAQQDTIVTLTAERDEARAEVERWKKEMLNILSHAESNRVTLPGVVDMICRALYPLEGGQG